MANAAEIPDIAPVVCEQCGEVGLLQAGQIRRVTMSELDALKQSEAWRTVIAPVKELVEKRKKAQNAINN